MLKNKKGIKNFKNQMRKMSVKKKKKGVNTKQKQGIEKKIN